MDFKLAYKEGRRIQLLGTPPSKPLQPARTIPSRPLRQSDQSDQSDYVDFGASMRARRLAIVSTTIPKSDKDCAQQRPDLSTVHPLNHRKIVPPARMSRRKSGGTETEEVQIESSNACRQTSLAQARPQATVPWDYEYPQAQPSPKASAHTAKFLAQFPRQALQPIWIVNNNVKEDCYADATKPGTIWQRRKESKLLQLRLSRGGNVLRGPFDASP